MAEKFSVEVQQDGRAENSLPAGSKWGVEIGDDGLSFTKSDETRVVAWRDVDDYHCSAGTVKLRAKDGSEMVLKCAEEAASASIEDKLDRKMLHRVYVVEDPSCSLPESVTIMALEDGEKLAFIDTITDEVLVSALPKDLHYRRLIFWLRRKHSRW